MAEWECAASSSPGSCHGGSQPSCPRRARRRSKALAGEAAQPKLTKPPKLVPLRRRRLSRSPSARADARPASCSKSPSARPAAVDAVRGSRVCGPCVRRSCRRGRAPVPVRARRGRRPARGDPHAVPLSVRVERHRAVAPTTAEFTGVSPRPQDQAAARGRDRRAGIRARAVTDERGEFRFDALAPGQVSVQLSAPELTAVRTEETLAAGQRVQTHLRSRATPAGRSRRRRRTISRFVVTAPPFRKEVVATEIWSRAGEARCRARRVTCERGREPARRRPLGAGSGALVVWGASPGGHARLRRRRAHSDPLSQRRATLGAAFRPGSERGARSRRLRSRLRSRARWPGQREARALQATRGLGGARRAATARSVCSRTARVPVCPGTAASAPI